MVYAYATMPDFVELKVFTSAKIMNNKTTCNIT
jgi:hypothetical protein